MSSLPRIIFINKNLSEVIAVIREDSSVLVFDFTEQERVFLPLIPTKKNFKKAYTYAKAASMIGTSSAKLKEIVEAGRHPAPARTYDKATLAPKTAYFSEDELLELRNICYENLRKNKYGIPYDNHLVSEEELIHRIRLTDERDFVKVSKDGTVRIYRA